MMPPDVASIDSDISKLLILTSDLDKLGAMTPNPLHQNFPKQGASKTIHGALNTSGLQQMHNNFEGGFVEQPGFQQQQPNAYNSSQYTVHSSNNPNTMWN
jgi:hypothetical protein